MKTVDNEVRTEGRGEAARERAHEFVATGQSHAEMSVDRVRTDVSTAAAAYPEGVVATSTLLFATARGAANGSVLGQSPRLTLLFAAAVSFDRACGAKSIRSMLTSMVSRWRKQRKGNFSTTRTPRLLTAITVAPPRLPVLCRRIGVLLLVLLQLLVLATDDSPPPATTLRSYSDDARGSSMIRAQSP